METGRDADVDHNYNGGLMPSRKLTYWTEVKRGSPGRMKDMKRTQAEYVDPQESDSWMKGILLPSHTGMIY